MFPGSSKEQVAPGWLSKGKSITTSEAAIFQVSVFTPEYAGMLFRILEFYSEVLEVYIEGLECQSYRSECGLELPLTFGS
jgi:hypothetical protein